MGAEPGAAEEQEDLVQEAVELGAEYVAVECVADLNLHKPDMAHLAEDNYREKKSIVFIFFVIFCYFCYLSLILIYIYFCFVQALYVYYNPRYCAYKYKYVHINMYKYTSIIYTIYTSINMYT